MEVAQYSLLSLSGAEGPSPAPDRHFRSLSGAEGPSPASDRHFRSLSEVEGPGAAVESGHRRNSVRFAHYGPSQRHHRLRFVQTCCRRAPPPAPVRGWTGPPVSGSPPTSLSSRFFFLSSGPYSCHPERQRRIFCLPAGPSLHVLSRSLYPKHYMKMRRLQLKLLEPQRKKQWYFIWCYLMENKQMLLIK